MVVAGTVVIVWADVWRKIRRSSYVLWRLMSFCGIRNSVESSVINLSCRKYVDQFADGAYD
jgi:hypothetical protein